MPPVPRCSHLPVAALLLASALTSCQSRRPVVESPPPKAEPILFEWYGDGVAGTPGIRIDLSEQKARFFRGGQEVGWSYVATGKEGHGTKPGTYSIVEKVVDKESTLYGIIEDAEGNVVDNDARVGREKVPPGGRFVHAPMPYWMRLTWYGIGMHAGYIPQPGEPASHGCIRLPKEMAVIFFENAPLGTKVTITY